MARAEGTAYRDDSHTMINEQIRLILMGIGLAMSITGGFLALAGVVFQFLVKVILP